MLSWDSRRRTNMRHLFRQRSLTGAPPLLVADNNYDTDLTKFVFGLHEVVAYHHTIQDDQNMKAFMDRVINACLCAELYCFDVVSKITGFVMRFKAIFPYLVIYHLVNLITMLQLTPMTLSMNAFMLWSS